MVYGIEAHCELNESFLIYMHGQHYGLIAQLMGRWLHASDPHDRAVAYGSALTAVLLAADLVRENPGQLGASAETEAAILGLATPVTNNRPFLDRDDVIDDIWGESFGAYDEAGDAELLAVRAALPKLRCEGFRLPAPGIGEEIWYVRDKYAGGAAERKRFAQRVGLGKKELDVIEFSREAVDEATWGRIMRAIANEAGWGLAA